MIELRPQPGPQEAFLSTPADIAIYGGAAGGGKSFGLVLDVARYADTSGFTGIYFRRTYPELAAPDGLWDLSVSILSNTAARPVHGDMEWQLPSGGRVVMRHLQHDKDIFAHQGAQYCGIYFDELTHFTGRQFWYLQSRNRSTCGVRPFVRATTNPEPDSFVADLIAWWLDEHGDPVQDRSGVLRWFVRRPDDSLDWDTDREAIRQRYPDGPEPLSLTFISARLDDNPALLAKDPGYRSRLQALHYVERARLLGGNWRVRPAAGTYFKRGWFRVFDEMPGHEIDAVRGWDKAATAQSERNRDPDWTRGVRVARLKDGGPVRYVVTGVASCRDTPGEVDRLMAATASQDGKATTQACWIDPGQAGKVDEAHIRTVLDGYRVVFERASKSKATYAGPVSSQAEGGMVGLMRGAWNEAFLSEAEAFPEGPHDDIVDAMSLAFNRLSKGVVVRAAPASPEGKSKWRI